MGVPGNNLSETPGFVHGPQWWSPGRGKCYDPCAAGLTPQVRQELKLISSLSLLSVNSRGVVR